MVSCWQEEAPPQRMEIYESRKDFLTCKSDEEFFSHGKMHDNIYVIGCPLTATSGYTHASLKTEYGGLQESIQNSC